MVCKDADRYSVEGRGQGVDSDRSAGGAIEAHCSGEASIALAPVRSAIVIGHSGGKRQCARRVAEHRASIFVMLLEDVAGGSVSLHAQPLLCIGRNLQGVDGIIRDIGKGVLGSIV